MVDFHKEWYNNLISHSNEKEILVEKITDLLKCKTHDNCLEIGLGTSAFFSEKLNDFFNEYFVIEKNYFNEPLKSNVKLILDDFEIYNFDKKFDVIIASHVVYYFNDLSKTIKKMISLLKDDGRIYFIVNGKESNYGPIKNAFAKLINKPCVFTYDILKSELRNYKIKEYSIQSSLSFNSYEELYESMRLSFDLYPNEYEYQKNNVIKWLTENIKENKFLIDQKIIEVTK